MEGQGDDWDDEEQTTVFDRSHAESAQALLQKSPTKPVVTLPPSPPASAPLASVPFGAATMSPVGVQATAAPAYSHPAMTPTIPRTTAPSFGAPRSKKTGLYAALGAGALVVVAGVSVFAGGGESGMLISVSGPNDTAVDGVKVLVDGALKCEQSPCKVEGLEAGSYVVKAEAAGYREMAGKAYELRSGEEKAINLELVPSANTGIQIRTKTAGLTLTVDGKKVGELPQEVVGLEPGEHTVEIDGSQFFKPFKQTVTVQKGEMLDFDPKLELEKGKVAIKLGENAEDADVTLVVNGKRRSITPHVKKGAPIILPVDGKEYRLVASRKGFVDYDEALEFSTAEPVKTVTISLSQEEEGGDEEEESSSSTTRSSSRSSSSSSPSRTASARAPATGKGKLNVNSIPVSNVIVDGRPMGSTPKMNISLDAGNHTVVFIHPQHGRKVRSVSVSAGQTATAAVRFP